MIKKIKREIEFFGSHPRGMRILLLTNLIYALVLPIIELFIGAYIMRASAQVSLVVVFQLALYTGIPLTFLINGYLLNRVPIAALYSFGMLLSGISMTAMMLLTELSAFGVFAAGLIMGLSYGFFWANRDFLALETTEDGNRNYYYGIETFFYTISFILVPFLAGVFIAATERQGWFGGKVYMAYYLLTGMVFLLTIMASFLVHQGNFSNPGKAPFVFFRFDKLWNKMMKLAALKGVAQGYIVTAPVMLIMKLVGEEGELGIIQSAGALLSAVLLYVLGRAAKPGHRLAIFTAGLSLFLLGSLFNAALYSSFGVILFVLCLIFARPLLDVAYFPVQLKVIDIVAVREQRNAFAYLFNHELGLYAGRLFGCGLFILLAYYASDELALRYALAVIALIQFLSVFVAKSILRDTRREKETAEEQAEVLKEPA